MSPRWCGPPLPLNTPVHRYMALRWFRALVCDRTLGLTCMRRGEVLALRWRRMDLARRQIVVEAATEKAGRGRVVPMTGAFHARLVELRSEHPRAIDGGDPVFVLADGTEVTSKALRSGFERAVKNCTGILLDKRSKVTFHCLRHTAASLMVAQGVPLFDVAKILGHSTLAVTMRYAHFAPEAGRAGIEKLGQALAAVTPNVGIADKPNTGMADSPKAGMAAMPNGGMATPPKADGAGKVGESPLTYGVRRSA